MCHYRYVLRRPTDCFATKLSPVVGPFWQLGRPPFSVNLATLKSVTLASQTRRAAGKMEDRLYGTVLDDKTVEDANEPYLPSRDEVFPQSLTESNSI